MKNFNRLLLVSFLFVLLLTTGPPVMGDFIDIDKVEMTTDFDTPLEVSLLNDVIQINTLTPTTYDREDLPSTKELQIVHEVHGTIPIISTKNKTVYYNDKPSTLLEPKMKKSASVTTQLLVRCRTEDCRRNL